MSAPLFLFIQSCGGWGAWGGGGTPNFEGGNSEGAFDVGKAAPVDDGHDEQGGADE